MTGTRFGPIARYIALVLVVVPLILRWGLGEAVRAQGDPGASAHYIDVPFSVCLFWAWALTTNTLSDMLASTGGRHKGSAKDRKQERARIYVHLSIAAIGMCMSLVPEIRSRGSIAFGLAAVLWFLAFYFLVPTQRESPL